MLIEISFLAELGFVGSEAGSAATAASQGGQDAEQTRLRAELSAMKEKLSESEASKARLASELESTKKQHNELKARVGQEGAAGVNIGSTLSQTSGLS